MCNGSAVGVEEPLAVSLQKWQDDECGEDGHPGGDDGCNPRRLCIGPVAGGRRERLLGALSEHEVDVDEHG